MKLIKKYKYIKNIYGRALYMKVIKRLGKKVIIYVVIFMLILSSCGSGVASAYTISEIGSAIARLC